MDSNILVITVLAGESSGIKHVILICGTPFNCVETKMFIFDAESAKQDRQQAFLQNVPDRHQNRRKYCRPK
jgi:hypothetical protein